MDCIEVKKSVPVKGSYDIIVAGGGVSVMAAAVPASRMGKKVLLIEKTICLGGLATIGLINLFVPLCNGRGVQIIKGMAEELLQLSVKYGYDTIPDCWKNGNPTKDGPRYVTRYSVPIFVLALTEFIKSEGVSILYDSVVSDVAMEGSQVKGVVVVNKSGFEYYTAGMFVDATGDGDLMVQAGVPTVQGRNFHTFMMHGADTEMCKKAAESGDLGNLQHWASGGNANLYGGGHPDGKPYWLGTNSQDVTNYVVENHIEALNKLKNDKDKAARDILRIPTMPQFRTTRHIDGNYTLKEADTYRHFDDSVGAICDFDRRDFLYEIPFGTLVRDGFGNIITAGRSAAGEGYAWDVLRVIPPAIISGQAAGVACALAIDEKKPVYGTDIKMLQKTLTAQNVMIHFDDGLVPKAGEESTVQESNMEHF